MSGVLKESQRHQPLSPHAPECIPPHIADQKAKDETEEGVQKVISSLVVFVETSAPRSPVKTGEPFNDLFSLRAHQIAKHQFIKTMDRISDYIQQLTLEKLSDMSKITNQISNQA